MQNPLILYYPHAYPPPILSHPMHAVPLFCPTPCMPSPYSVPPHAFPPPILSHLMHALPVYILSHPCMPSLYSIPPHACPPPYSIPAHAYPAPYSIPAHAYLPPILSHPMHTLALFYPSSCTPSPILSQTIHTPYMPSPYSIPLYACPLLFSTSPHMPS